MTPLNASDKAISPTVILSGPTRGLGRALFDQLVSHAYPVIGLGRDLARVAAVATNANIAAELIEVDFDADFNALTDALAAIKDTVCSSSVEPLVFISNASVIEPIGQATSLSLPGIERALRINCLAPLRIANALTEIAQAQHRSFLVINVSSGAACRPIRGWQAYCSSKAAYKMALDVLEAENSHVQVVHFDPGVMDTPMQQLIRRQQETDMPEVAAFRGYQEAGLLKAPLTVANEIILLMERRLS